MTVQIVVRGAWSAPWFHCIKNNPKNRDRAYDSARLISFHPQRFGKRRFQSALIIYIEAGIAKPIDKMIMINCSVKFPGMSESIKRGVSDNKGYKSKL
jgi:hypothetical protein